MAIRNTHRVGRHLVRDDESGAVYYDDEMVKRWDGLMVHKSQYEGRHPQEFVRAKNDPKALIDVRRDTPWPSPTNAQAVYIGTTNVPTPNGPASHLYKPGIGEMVVASTFIVR